MIFAKIEVDGKKAFGVFDQRDAASAALFEWANRACNGLCQVACSYDDKPYGEMTIQEDLDCYPLEVGKVLVSHIN